MLQKHKKGVKDDIAPSRQSPKSSQTGFAGWDRGLSDPEAGLGRPLIDQELRPMPESITRNARCQTNPATDFRQKTQKARSGDTPFCQSEIEPVPSDPPQQPKSSETSQVSPLPVYILQSHPKESRVSCRFAYSSEPDQKKRGELSVGVSLKNKISLNPFSLQKNASATSSSSNRSTAESSTTHGPTPTPFWTLLGRICVALALIGGSFIGPASNLLLAGSSLLATQWSSCLRIMYMTPIVAIEASLVKGYRQRIARGLSWKVVAGVLVNPAIQLVWNYGLFYGSVHLIQAHSYVCNTMFCIYIVLIGYCVCKKPQKSEIVGLVVTLAGVVLMFSDPDAKRTDGQIGSPLVYIFCLFCSFLAAFFMLINSYLVTKVPVFTLLLVQATLGFIYLGAVLPFMLGDKYQFWSIDAEWGAFGFLAKEQLVEGLLAYGLSTGLFGNAGYLTCLLFYPPVVVSALYLLEPIISQLIGYWMGIDQFPGWCTWVGTFCVIIGIGYLQKSSEQDRKKANLPRAKQAQTEAMLSTAQCEEPPLEPNGHSVTLSKKLPDSSSKLGRQLKA